MVQLNEENKEKETPKRTLPPLPPMPPYPHLSPIPHYVLSSTPTPRLLLPDTTDDLFATPPPFQLSHKSLHDDAWWLADLDHEKELVLYQVHVATQTDPCACEKRMKKGERGDQESDGESVYWSAVEEENDIM